MKYAVSFSAKITISLSQAASEGTNWMGVYGHEQRHILSRTTRVRINVVEPLEAETYEKGNLGVCQRRARVLQRDYKIKLEKQLNWNQTPDHANDPDPNNDTPADKTPYDPLPGSFPWLGGPSPA